MFLLTGLMNEKIFYSPKDKNEQAYYVFDDFFQNITLKERNWQTEEDDLSSYDEIINMEQSPLMCSQKIKADRRGPFHTVVKLGFHGRMHEIYDHEPSVVKIFLLHVLPQAVRKHKWNKLVKLKTLSSFLTYSDEALAMLIVENIALKCIDEVVNNGIESQSRDRPKTRYTQQSEICGWTDDGICRFVNLCSIASKRQGDPANKDKNIELDRIVDAKFGGKKLKRAEKRRLEEYGQMTDNDEARRIEEEKRKKRQRAQMYMMQMSMMGNKFDGNIDNIEVSATLEEETNSDERGSLNFTQL